jgi:hypothetical protein
MIRASHASALAGDRREHETQYFRVSLGQGMVAAQLLLAGVVAESDKGLVGVEGHLFGPCSSRIGLVGRTSHGRIDRRLGCAGWKSRNRYRLGAGPERWQSDSGPSLGAVPGPALLRVGGP